MCAGSWYGLSVASERVQPDAAMATRPPCCHPRRPLNSLYFLRTDLPHTSLSSNRIILLFQRLLHTLATAYFQPHTDKPHTPVLG